MKLSFVIPAHNEEGMIGTCLDSILKEVDDLQAKNNVEIIVVNNASTDRTKEVALARPTVRVVDEPRKGIVWARQAGYLASRGDLIANVDADTMLPKHWLKKVFEEFEKNQELVALSGPYIYYDLPFTVNLSIKLLFYPISYLAYLFIYYILRKGAMLQGGNYVVRRDALQKIGGFDTRIDFYGEDTDIARRISEVGKVKFTYSLPMYTSGRRLAEEGAFTMGIRYGANYLSIMIFKKPLTNNYVDVRNGNGKTVYSPKQKFRETVIMMATLSILFGMIAGIGYGAYRIVLLFISK